MLISPLYPFMSGQREANLPAAHRTTGLYTAPQGAFNQISSQWPLPLSEIIFCFISFTGCFQGLRIGGIVSLKWSDVDLKKGELRVIDGKNTRRYKSGYGKGRLVPINQMFLRIWRAWRAMNPEDDYVLDMLPC